MNELIGSILGDLSLGLTPTERILLLHLSGHHDGQRIEEIARSTGSRYRWIENKAHRLTRIGVLRRLAPNTYAVNPDFAVRP